MTQTTTTISPAFSADDIARRVTEIAAEIRKETGDGEVFLLCILKGASYFLADLMRAIPGRASYGFIDVVREPGDNQIADALEIDFLSYTDIRGRNVYVLKDVVNTGIIESYLLSQLRLHSPATLHLVALLDRPDVRTIDVESHFTAFTINDGIYAGYGLEFEQRYANLPFIGRVTV